MSLSADILTRHPKCRLRLARWLAVHQVFFRAREEEGEGKPNSRQGGKHPPSFRVTNDVTRAWCRPLERHAAARRAFSPKMDDVTDHGRGWRRRRRRCERASEHCEWQWGERLEATEPTFS